MMNDSPPQPPRSRTAWDRLVQRARSAPEIPGHSEPPLGFATRVVAGWQSSLPGMGGVQSLWRTRELFALRGAAIAMAITLAAVAMNYDLLLGLWYGDTALAGSFIHNFVMP